MKNLNIISANASDYELMSKTLIFKVIKEELTKGWGQNASPLSIEMPDGTLAPIGKSIKRVAEVSARYSVNHELNLKKHNQGDRNGDQTGRFQQ
ncbi:MAG: hypothetical protein V2B19_18980 [Pseudomonadota bacterium]